MARGRGATAREGRASERRAHSSLEGGLAFCYFWLRWNTAGRLSVGCHKKSDLFSSLSPMKLLCFLLPGAEEGRRSGRRGGRTVVAVGQRSVAGSLSSAVLTESERSAHATTSDSEPRWKEPPERQRGRPRLPDLLGPAKRLGRGIGEVRVCPQPAGITKRRRHERRLQWRYHYLWRAVPLSSTRWQWKNATCPPRKTVRGRPSAVSVKQHID